MLKLYVKIPQTTSTAVQCRPGKLSSRSNVSIDAFGFTGRPEKFPGSGSGAGVALSLLPSHFDCMYFCFLHGAKCIFFSVVHLFAAEQSILIKLHNLSDFPTKTSGNRRINLLYSSLALAISNSALKFTSITTRISPLLELELSRTSKYECSPEILGLMRFFGSDFSTDSILSSG